MLGTRVLDIRSVGYWVVGICRSSWRSFISCMLTGNSDPPLHTCMLAVLASVLIRPELRDRYCTCILVPTAVALGPTSHRSFHHPYVPWSGEQAERQGCTTLLVAVSFISYKYILSFNARHDGITGIVIKSQYARYARMCLVPSTGAYVVGLAQD